MIVGKITIGSGNDSIQVWADPTNLGDLNGSAAAQLSVGGSDLGDSLTMVGFGGINGTPGQRASSWMPSDSATVPMRSAMSRASRSQVRYFYWLPLLLGYWPTPGGGGGSQPNPPLSRGEGGKRMVDMMAKIHRPSLQVPQSVGPICHAEA